ncbi:MAG: hypothetical protein GX811_11955 [Lentisphaerae bacterium]|nr:hypothetical protein [Lentisphaerota bacterium]
MRLYRAIPANETTLNSHQKAFSKGDNVLGNISILDEIYSHIMPTHNLDVTHQNRIIFSFTDDIDVACRLIEKHPAVYSKIGYIDTEVPEDAFALLSRNSNILLVKPVFRRSDWVDLALYSASANGYTQFDVSNVNYASKGVPLINTLVPSRWGALSLARTEREYVVICRAFVPAIMSANDIASAGAGKHLKEFDLFISDNDPTNKRELLTVCKMISEKFSYLRFAKIIYQKSW